MKEAKRALKKSAKCEGWNDGLSGRIQVTSTPSGAAVEIDGNAIGTTPLEIAGLSDGEHALVATLEGHDELKQQLDAAPDTDRVLALTLSKTPVVQDTVVEEDVEEPEETLVVAEEPADKTVNYIIGGSLTAVGLGLFTFGAITDTVTIPGIDEEREMATSDAEGVRLKEDRDSAVTTALIGYIGGGVLLAGGVGYLVYTILDTPEAEPEYSFSPTVSPDQVGVTFRGRF